MIRRILEWSDEKYDKVVNDENEKHPYLKAAGLGAIEGIINGTVIAAPILYAGCIIWKKAYVRDCIKKD